MRVKKAKVIASVITAVLLSAIWLLADAESPDPTVETTKAVSITKEEADLIHRQETWISALEWCESRGKNSALNKMDRDGTPSYSNFQWKPTTILYFGKMYGLIATTTSLTEVPEILLDYELQRNIVRHMVKDKGVNWYNQFPDCVKLKVGLPPTN